MTRKILKLVFGIIFCLIISNKFTSTVQGQTPTPAGPAGQKWRCLKSEQVGGRTAVPPPEVDVNLTGAGFPSLHDIFVVLCVPPVMTGGQTPTNYKCTTGNSEYDRLVFNSDRSKSILPLTMELPKGSSPPQKIQAAGGNLDLIAHLSEAQGHVSYAFFGVTINEPSLVSGQRADTIQYATFQFEQNPAQCVSIRWDPYGRVFDSQSLEPMRGVMVRLLNAKKSLVIQKGLLNPQRTEADGQFNFFVAIKPGGQRTFYIDPVPAKTHTFTDAPNLHPNYVKVYSDLYKPNEPIIEAAGIPEHRDIPLDPGTNPPYRSKPVLMAMASLNLGNVTKFEGLISHPFSWVSLVGKITGGEISRVRADKFGAWEILLPNSVIPQNEALKVRITKVDLTTLSQKSPNKTFSKSVYQFLLRAIRGVFDSVSSKVSAQEEAPTDTDGEFQPILTYVEGFARDQDGNVLPFATVNVKLEMSDNLYYQTTADENGFFSILPQNLPIFVYYLEFESPDLVRPVKMTTEEFSQKNEEHLRENNVNLMEATKNGQSLLPTTPPSPASETVSPTPSAKPLFANDQQSFIIIILTLVVLLGVAGGVLIYIRKKQLQNSDLL
ncbi:hypothetical protein A3B40_05500 [Candidatus Roizmanbacteria bacterium RIFCSPLOWO2_01_FULL_37_16]|uniref:SD-repeat containing protein B domain-containing protein n=1 Tax=Candidatus Roizmanbacteria bacterium RIFCSPLOWO2_01_FULL_37_16 TaxID=1802058 RepID=A0A1F7IPN7_9BACT|nr:MAG: hypothetical protein A2859_01940 [Candidatus Roizmanbacteria bacterium RIFCSPHIGHO2_01_FULL_37_16b]OGK34113.1 MAG: hypothetical protein A3F57_06740 [Candidatus Roizmanbacteria bacterium RIFCSPHIGHO2_12_FULL_36_11]OGK45320.1 MAG: hypothetical protein A3B40_05500 [Candidatus Roizmanbacteria bacterium RIFCSPLOWO2_01_FULL_37_16]